MYTITKTTLQYISHIQLIQQLVDKINRLNIIYIHQFRYQNPIQCLLSMCPYITTYTTGKKPTKQNQLK